MDDAQRARYAAAIDYWLGLPGRWVNPQAAEAVVGGLKHAVVFNARVCVHGGTLWSGDLDLTEDEASLAALAEDTWQTIYVIQADEARGTSDPASLEARAVYWVNPTGGTGYSSALVLGPDDRLAVRARSR